MRQKNGAGILVIALSTGRALVALRSGLVSDPLTWSIPGGAEERYDGDLRQTAIREFIEETGYVPQRVLMAIAGEVRPDGSQYKVFLALEEREFRPRLDWENDAARWVTFDELMELPDKHPSFAAMLSLPSVREGLYRTMEYG
jgi:8-oxo-dGTP pyrophosphatase MutT (NUDIX family)